MRVGLVGVRGYGHTHLENACRLDREGRLALVAFADVDPAARGTVEEHAGRPVPAYGSDAGMLAAEDLDIVVVSTPIYRHAEMIGRAFDAGASVLVEKPPVVTVQDLDALVEAGRNAGLHCQVGFQTARAPVVRALADAVRGGILGPVSRVGCAGRWQRSDAYYARNGWAGRLVHEGRPVLDGTLTNPFAHALMNSLLVAGAAVGDGEHPADPVSARAELYRCRAIEGDDTAALRLETAGGPGVSCALTLCAERSSDPYVFATGPRGTAKAFYTVGRLDSDPPGLLDGLAAPGAAGPDLLTNLLDVVRGEDGVDLLCPLAMCRPFVLALNGMYESAGRPVPVPDGFLDDRTDEEGHWVFLRDVEDAVLRSAHEGLLFSELGVEWAGPTEHVELADYRRFDLFTGETPAAAREG